MPEQKETFEELIKKSYGIQLPLPLPDRPGIRNMQKCKRCQVECDYCLTPKPVDFDPQGR